MHGAAPHVDADFAHEVLDDLYRYRRKEPLVAWLLWALLGWVGAHRLYLGRDGTALLMMFTSGGLFVWWLVDAFFLGSFIRDHNAEQSRRRQEGLPPLELAFMPPLEKNTLQQPPAWTLKWQARSVVQQRRRFVGDLAVLVIAGVALGSLFDTDGAEEAILAVMVVVGLTAMGGTTGGLERFPVAHGLLKWNHRLRLFYYFNEPKNPLGLLLRPLVGLLLAPFRMRDRAEVRLYLELGFAFTLAFLLLDLVEHVLQPLTQAGSADIGIGTLAQVWASEAAVTFVVTYAFAAPIGAVLTLHMLMRPTHTVPRLLGAITLMAVLTGVVIVW
jgi:hypothetical protein